MSRKKLTLKSRIFRSSASVAFMRSCIASMCMSDRTSVAKLNGSFSEGSFDYQREEQPISSTSSPSSHPTLLAVARYVLVRFWRRLGLASVRLGVG